MLKQSIPITIGDQTYQLRFTFNSFIRLEEELGIPISDIDKIFPTENKDGKVVGSVNLRDVRAFFWAGLIHENKDLTLEEAGELIEEAGGIVGIVETLVKAFSNAFPADEDVKKK